MNAVSAASSRCSYQLRFESLFHAGAARWPFRATTTATW
jgi:hypothetical protein